MTGARFLAFAGEPDALRERLGSIRPERSRAKRLNRVVDAPDLIVFATPEARLISLEEEHGLVIGRLFRGVGPCAPVETLGLAASRHAAWSRGQSLLDDYWGGYVAFLRDGGEVTVLRDPSGAVPVYWRESAGLHLYFSDAALIDGLGAGPGTLDQDFLRQWLTFPFLRTARTGIAEVRELLPGTRRRTGPALARLETGWRPWRAAAPERQIRDFDQAARRLRTTALAVIPAQLQDIESPLLELSGGLDSSIVAACLAQARLSFRAVNFVTAAPDGDESIYAARVAEALGADLAEVHEEQRRLDMSPVPGQLRPPLSPVLQPVRRALRAHGEQAGSNDFVTGAGGDNLFCFLTTPAPILDAAAGHGLRSALTTLRYMAVIGDCTIWTAARLALRRQLRQNCRPGWKADGRFLAPEAVAEAPDPHPWLDHPPGALPGKIEHVESLVRVQHFLTDRYAWGANVHHPLLCQPLIELCLAVPTWLWVRDGRNRAVARAAFAELLPKEVIRRRTKGRLESLCLRAYAAHHARIGPLLLDGELARRGLVDRSSVETYLDAGSAAPDNAYYRLFDLVSLELWLRGWRS